MNIIITGAGKGIGFELCRKFIQQPGHSVIGISRNISALAELQKKHPALLPFSFDLEVNDYSSVPKLLSFFCNNSVDILINNAGYLVNKPFNEISEEDNDRMLAVNYKSPFKLIQKLLPFFSDNAHIVNISSMGGFQGSIKFSGLSGYSASKAALTCLTECLADELKEKNIKANCLCLGSVQTEMLQKAFPGYKAPVKPEQIADFITEFALKAHHYLNGKIIPVTRSTP